MKIHVISDLHREDNDAFNPPATDADVVLLPGDIDVGVAGVEWAMNTFSKPVVYVLGNHEPYGHNVDILLDQMRELTRGTHVHVLENEACIIEGVRFIGATLWTDFELADDAYALMLESEARKSDFRMIEVGRPSRPIRAADMVERHRNSREFIRRMSNLDDGARNVVVTHYGPSSQSIVARRQSLSMAATYASDVEALMGPNIVAWAHGHLHDSVNYNVAGTRVIANPRGGRTEISANPDFESRLVIEV